MGFDEIPCQVLPHPFFRCQRHIFLADAVENQRLAGAVFYVERIFCKK